MFNENLPKNNINNDIPAITVNLTRLCKIRFITCSPHNNSLNGNNIITPCKY